MELSATGTLKMMDCPLKVRTLTPSSKFGVSWKINWTDLHSNESFWLELQKAWDNISAEVLRKYTDTMPERCAAVIAANGGHTKY